MNEHAMAFEPEAATDPFWSWFNTEAKPLLPGRAETFIKIFEYLDGLNRPVGIVETGCIRKESWEGDGHSTVLFDRYVQARGGTVYTVDIDPKATRLTMSLTSRHVKVHTGDSVEYLKGLAERPPNHLIDFVYLDSFDWLVSHPIPAALHHMQELAAIMPLLRDETLVVVDDCPGIYYDSPFPHTEIGGKGMFVAKHADSVGATLRFHQYQAGWTHMNQRETHDENLVSLISRARDFVDACDNVNAARLYQVVVGRTTPPKTGVDRVAHGEACLFFARVAGTKLRYGTAADWYREALAVDPRAVDYRIEMAVKALRPMANSRIAQQEAYKATRIEPDNPYAWRTLGGFEHELGNAAECIKCYDRQLELLPDDPSAIMDRIVIALDTADYDLPRELCKKLIGTPREADATHCLAMVAYREGRHEDAIALYDKALADGCHDVATAHWNKSLALHSIGRYREGWIEHEWRKLEKNNPALAMPMVRFTVPLWTGKEEGQHRIHVHAEAGMGDNIAMARYLPMTADLGHDVRYETHEEMRTLMARSFPNVKVVRKAPDYPGAIGLDPFDYHLPIGSFPAVFETDIDTVPWNGPYLVPDPELVGKYGDLLRCSTNFAVLGGRKHIGLCWSAGIRDSGVWIKQYGLRKSMPFETLRPVVYGAPMFVSLQVGPERAEHDIVDVLPAKPTWDDTAALVANLDLVITVDTAVAHLAGAMGKPVWLMMHTEGSWHWMAERPGALWNARSPWYPSVRIYRQKAPNQWGDVIAKIAADLKDFEPCGLPSRLTS